MMVILKGYAINTDNIIRVSIDPLHSGSIIYMANGSSISINMSVNEIVEAINNTTSTISADDIAKMVDALINSINHLENAMAAGLQYVGKSCR